MGSLQYAGAHLRTPLFVVLGHEGCGAVKAALKTKLDGHEHRSRIQTLIDNILPGLANVGSNLSEDERLTTAVEANVRWSIHQILRTPEGQNAMKAGIKLAGAVYEIAFGKVRLLSQPGVRPVVPTLPGSWSPAGEVSPAVNALIVGSRRDLQRRVL